MALWPRTIAEADGLDLPVAKFARHALNDAWRRVAKKGKRVGELDGEERHKMRKALKQLRYTLEFFSSLYKPAEVRPYVETREEAAGRFWLCERTSRPLGN